MKEEEMALKPEVKKEIIMNYIELSDRFPEEDKTCDKSENKEKND